MVEKMAEYIDREAISKLFDSECRGECAVCPHDDRGDCTLMNQIPTADVQPVKHGRWLLNSDRIPVCSICDGIALQKILLRFPTPEYYSKFVLSNYCPHCGAIIDGGDF